MPKVIKKHDGKYFTVYVRDDCTVHILFKEMYMKDECRVAVASNYVCAAIIPSHNLYTTISEVRELFHGMRSFILRELPSRKSIIEKGKMYIELDFTPKSGEDNNVAYLRTHLTPDKNVTISALFCELIAQDLFDITNQILDSVEEEKLDYEDYQKRLYLKAIFGTEIPECIRLDRVKDKTNPELIRVLKKVALKKIVVGPGGSCNESWTWHSDLLKQFDLSELKRLYEYLDKIELDEIE